MKRKTTITLTIAGLLGLAGVLYGSASFFSPVIDPQGNGPIGVAASPTDLIASEFCTANGVPFANIDRIDCQGGFSVLTTIPTIPGCYERYMAIAPLVSASATPAPFTPRDIFITQGPIIYQLRPPNPLTPFATIPDSGCSPDHTGITFDHVGTFDRNMIVTCVNGGVWKVDGAGTVTNIAFVTFNGEGRELEGPAVVPLSFGPHGGQIWAADENFPGAAPPVLSTQSTALATLL